MAIGAKRVLLNCNRLRVTQGYFEELVVQSYGRVFLYLKGSICDLMSWIASEQECLIGDMTGRVRRGTGSEEIGGCLQLVEDICSQKGHEEVGKL